MSSASLSQIPSPPQLVCDGADEEEPTRANGKDCFTPNASCNYRQTEQHEGDGDRPRIATCFRPRRSDPEDEDRSDQPSTGPDDP